MHCRNWSQVNLQTELEALPEWLKLKYTLRDWTKESDFRVAIHLIWFLIDLKAPGIKRKLWIVVSLCAGRIPVEESQVIMWYNLVFMRHCFQCRIHITSTWYSVGNFSMCVFLMSSQFHGLFLSPRTSSVQTLYHPLTDTEFHEKIQNFLWFPLFYFSLNLTLQI